jgi:hypothetical protein
MWIYVDSEYYPRISWDYCIDLSILPGIILDACAKFLLAPIMFGTYISALAGMKTVWLRLYTATQHFVQEICSDICLAKLVYQLWQQTKVNKQLFDSNAILCS